ncbi:MAG: hypothetical protein ABWZ79_05955 [Pedobacter agri]
MPAKRKSDIPYQLLGWHEHVAFTRKRLPADTPYKEVLQRASLTYKKRKGGADAHEIAGKKKKPATKRTRKGGCGEDAHEIAGKKKKKPAAKRSGGGVISDIAHTAANILNLFGAKKKPAKKPAAKRARK